MCKIESDAVQGIALETEPDTRSGACGCKDAEYNLDDGELCRHTQRVAIVRGERPFPAVPVDDVDEQIGIHIPNGVNLADVINSSRIVIVFSIEGPV